jgi:hypothetical protein
MNFMRVLTLVLFMVLLASACQSMGKKPGSENTGEYPPVELVATPPLVAYSYPPSSDSTNLAPILPRVLYPDAKDGDEIRWDQAVSVILNDEVSEVTQTHDLKVYLTLKDGRTLVTVEPVIDEVIKVIQKCGENCKSIRIATE